jgi:O-succinylbenzoate synthase
MPPSAYRFSFRPYRLRFKAPVRTAHGLWLEREGALVRLETEDGRVGWGEAAPIPAFGGGGAAEVLSAVRGLPERIGAEEILGIAPRPACLAHALRVAAGELECTGEPPRGSPPAGAALADPGRAYPMAALLPAGKPALAALGLKADAGFRTFKWKVGVGDLRDELFLLDDVCAALPSGGRLRLDANGAWDRRAAERWLERCAERPIEFVEQPVASDARGADDTLRGLAADYPTPLALDESVAGDGDVERWLGGGWPGVYVIKPLLLADPDATLHALHAAKAPVVFSSALETAAGARTALRLAFAWNGERKALGFGVWPLFENPAFDGPAAAPFIRRSDVEAIRPETVWEALK